MKIASCLLCLSLMVSAASAQDAATIVAKVNANNAKVKSLVADVENVTQKRNFVITATGKMHYEKDRNFRMQASQVVNGQPSSDIGSNGDYFWFWVRKLDPQTMYFSSYKNLYQTGLQDSLHPIWMMDSLGMGQVDTKGAKVYSASGYAVVVKQAMNPRGQNCWKMTYIDPAKPVIAGHRIYSDNQKLLTSVQIEDWYATNAGIFIPKRIVIVWYTEGIRLTQSLTNPHINTTMPAGIFKMPRTNLRIVDMGRDKTNWDKYREEP